MPKKYIRNWFSNFQPFEKPFEYQGILYKTPEHLYQAMKTLDLEERKLIASQKTPGKAKRLGRSVQLRSNWEDVKVLVMYNVLKIKFSKGTEWAEKLIQEEDDIVEWNNWGDTFWGVVKDTGQGENWLGILLMKIREELKG